LPPRERGARGRGSRGAASTVTAGVTPSPYVLPILLVNDQNEWKDFGIQVNLKVYPNGEEQADRVVGNEWEVGVMDPFYAVKAGNEGDVVIVGLAGNLPSQFYLMSRKANMISSMPQARQALQGREILIPGLSTEHYFLSLLIEKPNETPPPPPPTAKIDPAEAF